MHCNFRQVQIAKREIKIAGFCDLHRVSDRLGYMAEQLLHLGSAFVVKLLGLKTDRLFFRKRITGLDAHHHRLIFRIQLAQIVHIISCNQR